MGFSPEEKSFGFFRSVPTHPEHAATTSQKWDNGSRAKITRPNMAKKTKIEGVTRSSGNVFADLRLPDADEKLTKVRLAVAINKILEHKRLRQAAAAKLLNLNQPKISALANYRLEGFSVERLLRFLNALDRDVQIIIRPKRSSRRPGSILITAA